MKQLDAAEFTKDLIAILSRLAEVPPEQISLDDDLREDVGLDSLQSMELLSRICEKWDVDVEMEDMIEVKTVRDVVTFMTRLAKEDGQA
jgi:acyl carrier protein